MNAELDSSKNVATVVYKMIMARRAADRKNAARRAKHQAYLDCGMVRVKGNLGGTYYVLRITLSRPGQKVSTA